MTRLRWVFFMGALVFFVESLLGGATPRSVAGFAVCGFLWWLLSRKKARSLDAR